MSGILRLESLTKGNTLKQGDKTPLKYRLFDADGETLNIAGKSAQVRLVYPDFLTIGYEKDGLTVAQDDTVTFTIDSVIPSRIYHVEIIVDDKFIFPSRADESKFTVDNSTLGTEANIIEVVGVDQIVNKVLDKIEDGVLNLEPEDGSIITKKYADKSVTANKVNFGFDFMPEIVNFERGFINSSGVFNPSGTVYTSDFIPIQTHQSEVINNDENYLFAVVLFNSSNAQVFDSGFSTNNVNIKDLGIRYSSAVSFVIKVRNIPGSGLPLDLGDYFSSNIYITTDNYPLAKEELSISQTQDWLRKFPEANFNTDVMGVDLGGNLTLARDISTSQFHRWFLYFGTDLSRDIQDVTVKFVTNSSQNQVNHRVFVESSDGKLVWFGYNHIGTVDCYTFDKFTNTFSTIPHSSGNPTTVPYPSSKSEFDMSIRLSGTFAVVYIDGVEVVAYNLSNFLGDNVTRCGLAYRGNIEVRQTVKNFEVQYAPTPYAHMSFDDVFSILKDLTDNSDSYTSVFDQPQFKLFKNAYNAYGVKITLNVFYKLSTDSFNLSQVTTKFKTEFSNNSHWLKFAYHATDETVKPSTLSDADLVTDVQNVHGAIDRFAGQRSIDKVPRFGFFNVSKSGLKALRYRNLVLGALGADDARAENSGLTGVGLYTLQNSDSYLDKENSIHYFKTEPRLDSVSDERIKEIIDTGLSNPNQNQVFILFSHHINERVLNTMASYTQSRGLRFDFPMNNL